MGHIERLLFRQGEVRQSTHFRGSLGRLFGMNGSFASHNIRAGRLLPRQSWAIMGRPNRAGRHAYRIASAAMMARIAHARWQKLAAVITTSAEIRSLETTRRSRAIHRMKAAAWLRLVVIEVLRIVTLVLVVLALVPGPWRTSWSCRESCG